MFNLNEPGSSSVMSKLNSRSRILTAEKFPSGSLIFPIGDIGKKTYLVKDGRVQIFEVTPKGDTVIKGFIGPGQLFGERALLGPAARTYGAKATIPTICAVIHYDRLQSVLNTTEPFVAGLYRVLAGNLQSMIDKGADLDCLIQEIEDL